MSDAKVNVPVPELKESYVNFKKEVILWEQITSLKEKSHASTLVIKLPEKAKAVALDINIDELKTGVEREEGAVKLSGVGTTPLGGS